MCLENTYSFKVLFVRNAICPAAAKFHADILYYIQYKNETQTRKTIILEGVKNDVRKTIFTLLASPPFTKAHCSVW